MYLMTNQEHKAFDLKNGKKGGGGEEGRKGTGEERVPPAFLWLAEMQIRGETSSRASALRKKFLEKQRLSAGNAQSLR